MVIVESVGKNISDCVCEGFIRPSTGWLYQYLGGRVRVSVVCSTEDWDGVSVWTVRVVFIYIVVGVVVVVVGGSGSSSY